MALHQSSHDIQAKPRPFAYGLGCKERIENAIAYLGRNTRPIVHNPDRYAIAFAASSNFNLSSLVYSVQGVINQIRPHLIELATETVYSRKVFLDIQTHSYGSAFRLRAQYGKGVCQTSPDVDRLRYRR